MVLLIFHLYILKSGKVKPNLSYKFILVYTLEQFTKGFKEEREDSRGASSTFKKGGGSTIFQVSYFIFFL